MSRLATCVDLLRRAGNDVGHPDLAERLVRALEDGVATLDALPRDDAFWIGWANTDATLFKLHDHASLRLAADPGDRPARWALIALALAHGGNDGGLPLLAPLVAADPAAAADAVAIAEWVWEEIGLNNAADLRAVLSAADRVALEDAARRDPAARELRIALSVLDGADLPEALARA